MALWFDLRVGSLRIGFVEIRRTERRMVTHRPMRYVGEIEHKGILRRVHVQHYYDDGALVLLRKVLNALELSETGTDPDGGPHHG